MQQAVLKRAMEKLATIADMIESVAPASLLVGSDTLDSLKSNIENLEERAAFPPAYDSSPALTDARARFDEIVGNPEMSSDYRRQLDLDARQRVLDKMTSRVTELEGLLGTNAEDVDFPNRWAEGPQSPKERIKLMDEMSRLYHKRNAGEARQDYLRKNDIRKSPLGDYNPVA